MSANGESLKKRGFSAESHFKNSADFYGAIYAPNADVTMHNSGNVYGAVTAKSFEQKNSGTFNYDTSLRDVSIDEEAIYFTITNWHEVYNK